MMGLVFLLKRYENSFKKPIKYIVHERENVNDAFCTHSIYLRNNVQGYIRKRRRGNTLFLKISAVDSYRIAEIWAK
jgi:ribosomal protein S17E